MQGRTMSDIETWRWWWSDSKLPNISSSSHSKRRRLGWVAMFLHSVSPAIHMCVSLTHNVHAHTCREVFIFHLFLTRRRTDGPPTMWHTSIHCCTQSSRVSVVEVLAAFYWHSRPDVGSESSRKWFLAFVLTHVERFFFCCVRCVRQHGKCLQVCKSKVSLLHFPVTLVIKQLADEHCKTRWSYGC